MEGLLIAEELRRLETSLPARRFSWRFPDAQTFVLPLAGGSLWLSNRPPEPRFEWRPSTARGEEPDRSHSGFQDLLASRATGTLESASQRKLDRVLTLRFAAGTGFVETPPVCLIAELTGRNSNLILTDVDGIVLGAAREVRSEINRFREVVAGRPYSPPPPYDKMDPREAGREELRQALAGKSLRSIRKIVDGIGPELTRALARIAELREDEIPSGGDLERLLDALERIVREPARVVSEALLRPDLATLRERDRRQALTDRVDGVLRRQLELVEKRIGDLERSRRAAERADELRRAGDLLLAFAGSVPQGASKVTLTDFEGEEVELELDPSSSAAANARGYYDRARKREARARQASARRPELEASREELTSLRASLTGLGLSELESLSERFAPAVKSRRRSGPGVRYTAPHGYTVLVGRSARENDEITFKIARSRDVWLHVQGYHGAHVVIQANNREVPFDTILFAARLAAGYSKAGESENVPVDYTLRKHVWKVKGQSPGAVNFAHQKTVYVDPTRHPGLDQ